MTGFDLEDALDRAQAEPASRRARLLCAAETLFAERGYDGVRVRDVADSAGVNIATLHLHWKTKATLYEAVCRLHAREVMGFLADVQRDVSAPELPLAERLAAWVDATAELFARRPPIAPLALQSVLDQSPADLPSLFLHDVSLFRRIESMFRKAKADGDPDVEPVLAVLSIFYFGILVFSDSPLQQALLGGSVNDDAEVRARVARFGRALIARLLGMP